MATRSHSPIAWTALASILLALAIGSIPVVALVTLNDRLSAVVPQ